MATLAANGPARQWRMADYFPSAGKPAFTSRGKIARPRHPPLRFGPAGAGPVRPPPFVAMKAAMGAVDPTKESTL
jgi:hypothetical protein